MSVWALMMTLSHQQLQAWSALMPPLPPPAGAPAVAAAAVCLGRRQTQQQQQQLAGAPALVWRAQRRKCLPALRLSPRSRLKRTRHWLLSPLLWMRCGRLVGSSCWSVQRSCTAV
jgi:hypothetical protein